jgi:hypothetical protein
LIGFFHFNYNKHQNKSSLSDSCYSTGDEVTTADARLNFFVSGLSGSEAADFDSCYPLIRSETSSSLSNVCDINPNPFCYFLFSYSAVSIQSQYMSTSFVSGPNFF